jgi:hypothetical protein
MMGITRDTRYGDEGLPITLLKGVYRVNPTSFFEAQAAKKSTPMIPK